MSLPQLLEILGLTVLHMLWIGALIGALAFVMLRSNRTSDPRARHRCAIVGLIALLVGTVSTFAFLTSTNSTPGIVLIDATGTSTLDGLQPSSEATAPASDPASRTSGLRRAAISTIACLWIAGIAFMSTRLTHQWFKVRRLRVIGVVKPQPRWIEMFETLKSRIGIHSRLSMMVSHTIDAPMVVGWLQPLVLVPATAFTSLNPEQLKMVLAHELLHIVRRDHLVNMLQAFIEVLLFFHPVTWWLSRQVRIERENCCDDGTLDLTGSPRAFAEALLVLESLRTDKTTSPQLLTATGGSLMHRVSRLFGSDQTQPLNVGWRSLSACTLLAAAGLVFATTAIEPNAAAQDRRAVDTEKVDLEQLKTRIEERIRAMGVDLRKQVAAGDITADDARARFEDGERRMWMRYRAAEEKQVEGTKDAGSDYDQAFAKMTEMVKDGTITPEQMQQRLKRMKLAGDQAADRELEELKTRIEERIRAMGEDLRRRIAAGEISEADAKKRFDEGEERMWMRYRAAEAKNATAGKSKAEKIDLEKLKIQIDERVRAMGEDLRRRVTAGEISEADAKARFEEGEKRMWMRYRAAEKKNAEATNAEATNAEAKNDAIDLDDLKVKIEARIRTMGVDLRQKVAAGEIREADAKARFEKGEKRMWMRYRAAEEKANDSSKKAGGERRKSKTDYDAAVEKMTQMVRDGKITREQMQRRLDRMKQTTD